MLVNIMKEVGGTNYDRHFDSMGGFLEEAGPSINSPIVHVATSDRSNVSYELFREIFKRFGATRCNEY